MKIQMLFVWKQKKALTEIQVFYLFFGFSNTNIILIKERNTLHMVVRKWHNKEKSFWYLASRQWTSPTKPCRRWTKRITEMFFFLFKRHFLTAFAFKKLDRWRPQEACESNRGAGRETSGSFYIFIGTMLILIIIICSSYLWIMAHHRNIWSTLKSA